MALARENFRRSGLSDHIEPKEIEAGMFLRAAEAGLHGLFFSIPTAVNVGWWPEIERVLFPGGWLVVDNATSHPHEFFAGARDVVRAFHD